MNRAVRTTAVVRVDYLKRQSGPELGCGSSSFEDDLSADPRLSGDDSKVSASMPMGCGLGIPEVYIRTSILA